VQSLAIANVLNGLADTVDYAKAPSSSGIIRYIFPDARLLIVDDIHTNLKVAEGLLAPYRAVVDTCLSGGEAIEMIKNNHYDIVFMDHMMPDMDGIEAVAYVREWEKEQSQDNRLPIAALTANAVSGVREMFLENGFDDFLAKPIDVNKLDEILNKWIPVEKRERGYGKNITGDTDSQLPNIYGIDVKKGIRMTGGKEENFFLVLSIYNKDAQERQITLQKSLEENDISAFVINVHALKSASASVGAMKISEESLRLEMAGKEGNMDFIRENFDSFMEELSKTIKGISAALKKNEESNNEETPPGGGIKTLMPLLQNLKEMLKNRKIEGIERILGKINRQQLPDTKTKEFIDTISDDVLMSEFDRAAENIDNFLSDKP